MSGALFYGDNLAVLRESVASESVDLIYLDPPFNSQANYNVLFRSPTGEDSRAQIEAFEDTWHWNDAAEFAFDDVMRSDISAAAELLRAIRSCLKENDMMAYLAMMAVRLIELHRVLKENGSLYLHCDPTASHYLKALLDAIFGPAQYRREIVWRRHGAHNDARRNYAAVHDTIFFYTKSDRFTFNPIHEEHDPEYVQRSYRHKDGGRLFRVQNLASPNPRPNLTYAYTALNGVTYQPHSNGWKYTPERMAELDRQGRLVYPKTPTGRLSLKNYLDEMKGSPLADVWTNVGSLNGSHNERLGYPTQKPVALLERIVQVSSNEGDIVLDPFCGCGTAIHAAEKLGRDWVGIDITHLAISLIEKRLKDAFPSIVYAVHGTPKDLGGAQALADRDKYQFQWWAVSLVNAVPWGGKKKGADSGIDGVVYFKPDARSTEKAIVSVKGGATVGVGMIRDLAHVVERERAKVGIFVSLAALTHPMETEATKEGFYETAFGRFKKIQLFTIADLFSGKRPQLPWAESRAFKKTPREEIERQEKMAFG